MNETRVDLHHRPAGPFAAVSCRYDRATGASIPTFGSPTRTTRRYTLSSASGGDLRTSQAMNLRSEWKVRAAR